MQENQQQVDNFSRDLRRNYRQILEMLDANKKNNALEFVKQQIGLLQESSNKGTFFTLRLVLLLFKLSMLEFEL